MITAPFTKPMLHRDWDANTAADRFYNLPHPNGVPHQRCAEIPGRDTGGRAANVEVDFVVAKILHTNTSCLRNQLRIVPTKLECDGVLNR